MLRKICSNRGQDRVESARASGFPFLVAPSNARNAASVTTIWRRNKRGPQNLQRKPSEYLRSIYLDIVSPLPEAMRFALNFSSADKLLFSSDHPWVQPKEILEPLRSLKLPANTETLILRGNARQLFRL
jgi:predicted TIM-barrel fold metal-dependent hydrolase